MVPLWGASPEEGSHVSVARRYGRLRVGLDIHRDGDPDDHPKQDVGGNCNGNHRPRIFSLGPWMATVCQPRACMEVLASSLCFGWSGVRGAWATVQRFVVVQHPEDMPRAEVAQTEPTKKFFPQPLRNLFDTDFKDYFGFGSEVTIPSPNGNGTLAIPVRLLMDFSTRSQFLAYFIPMSIDPMYACPWIVKLPMRTIELFAKRMKMTSILPGETAGTTSTDLVFSRRIYVYYEPPLSLQQLAALETLFTQNGLSVEFRDGDYQTLHWYEQREIPQTSQPPTATKR